jgi:uncharacterized damage-inducible protein DinB
MNKRLTCFSALLSGMACAAFAQGQPTPANPLTSGEKVFYSAVAANIVAAAQKMPEENYSFKPTPEVRSFGAIVGHAADAQYLFCSNVLGEKNPSPGVEKTKTTKADLVQGIQDAVAYCNKAFDALTDAHAADTVKLFGRDVPKLTVLSINTAHADEHYGNLVTYLRIKGIVPPSSEPRK